MYNSYFYIFFLFFLKFHFISTNELNHSFDNSLYSSNDNFNKSETNNSNLSLVNESYPSSSIHTPNNETGKTESFDIPIPINSSFIDSPSIDYDNVEKEPTDSSSSIDYDNVEKEPTDSSSSSIFNMIFFPFRLFVIILIFLLLYFFPKTFRSIYQYISSCFSKSRSNNNDFHLYPIPHSNREIVPNLVPSSYLIQNQDLVSLVKHLPPRCKFFQWNRLYCTTSHGSSLTLLVQNMKSITSPCILLVQDTFGHIFGSYLPESIHYSSSYYGNQLSSVFQLSPAFQYYTSTGLNNYFCHITRDNIIIGGGNKCALFLDKSLQFGFSHYSETFNNNILSFKESFEVRFIECWALQ